MKKSMLFVVGLCLIGCSKETPLNTDQKAKLRNFLSSLSDTMGTKPNATNAPTNAGPFANPPRQINNFLSFFKKDAQFAIDRQQQRQLLTQCEVEPKPQDRNSSNPSSQPSSSSAYATMRIYGERCPIEFKTTVSGSSNEAKIEFSFIAKTDEYKKLGAVDKMTMVLTLKGDKSRVDGVLSGQVESQVYGPVAINLNFVFAEKGTTTMNGTIQFTDFTAKIEADNSKIKINGEEVSDGINVPTGN